MTCLVGRRWPAWAGRDKAAELQADLGGGGNDGALAGASTTGVLLERVLGDGQAQTPPLTLKLRALTEPVALGVGDIKLAVIVHLDIQAAGRRQNHAVDITIAADMQHIADAGAEADEIGVGGGSEAG